MSKIKKEQNIMFSPFFNCYKLSVITSKRSKSDNEEKRMDPLTLIPSYTGTPISMKFGEGQEHKY
ncbi:MULTISPECIES: hypothetical protein [unclassified Flavobacterium]|uniref:hypothetical protein n=1 Tax=unclassified Flavobacterium TaxID=196869 RepID=UPI000F0C41A2|nr:MULTISPECIES: hypothetical protein [unclassified Flavobacterium]AYN03699.1 hypothetical protein EAG11_05535 [Flavobacterium sp. 140616W15]MCD0474163.1 hypothetical protein [Flavobacterium sp. EDS]